MGRNVLKSSLLNASFSIFFQIFCRAITFAINAFILRRVDHNVLGIMNVRLLLLESTLLFLSKESISRAALSSTTQHKNKCTWAQLINQMWVTVPMAAILSIPCLYVWLNVLSPVGDEYQSAYKFGCYAMVLSCIFELTAEAPAFVAQVFCFVKLKVVLDTLHIFVRSVVFIILVLNNKNIAIYAFGIAQFTSCLVIIGGNYGFFKVYIQRLRTYREVLKKHDNDIDKARDEMGHYYEHMNDFPFNSVTEMVPTVLKNPGSAFNSDLNKLVLSFIKQGILKQVLTEGEKYVMSISPVLNFQQQAVYDIVNNMGSLAARFIFRPIEDSSYFYFTQTIAREIALKDQEKDKVKEASQVLKNVCKGVTSIGLIGFVFGQSFSGTLLLLYGGQDFVEGGLPETLLRWHALAIILLAVNGITEGYMFATNTSKQIDRYNYYMAIFSVTFLILSYQLTNYFGAVGFIWANCCNMAFRIAYSTNYIAKQYKDLHVNPLEGLIPGKIFGCTLIVAGIACKYSEMHLLPKSMLYHVLVGGIFTLITLLSWIFENREIAMVAYGKYKNKSKSE
ncbi:man(5)GlcNAc(2)-PP-dolichol translocation protein RFT1 [Chironomus tepperi]|uniref:man(5)GlcNAc(2)-PP-dolichol translocation protein RFT1 n=1 Tax=Chironomus tepperi TaxID=113505 RepID=UPI00391F769C